MSTKGVDWEQVRRSFPATARWAYLNTAGGGALSVDAAEAAKQYYDDNLADADVPWPRWREQIEDIRGAVATFLGAGSDEVAFVGNASLAMNHVARLLAGEGSVLAPMGDFPAVTLPWLNLEAPIYFVESDADGVLSLNAIEAAMKPDTRVLATSFVQYATGFRQDMAGLARLCRERGVYLVVDATQGLGAFPLELGAEGPDCLIFSGYKWITAGYGLAVLAIRRELLASRRMPAVGWRSASEPYRLLSEELDISSEARALELGHPPVPGIFALGAAVKLFQQIGIDRIAERVLVLTRYLRERVTERGLRIRSPGAPAHLSGISIVEVPRANECAEFLLTKGVCVTVRSGALRVSVHLYNNEEDIDRFVAALDEFLD